MRPKLIVTTNYDRVLGWSNSAANFATNSQRANLADLFAGSDVDKPFVWHLHGHIDDPDSLILAPQQYDRLYREAVDAKLGISGKAVDCAERGALRKGSQPATLSRLRRRSGR